MSEECNCRTLRETLMVTLETGEVPKCSVHDVVPAEPGRRVPLRETLMTVLEHPDVPAPLPLNASAERMARTLGLDGSHVRSSFDDDPSPRAA
jgi:hypothetical protein